MEAHYMFIHEDEHDIWKHILIYYFETSQRTANNG